MQRTDIRNQPPITDPQLYLNSDSMIDWIHQHFEGNIDTFVTAASISRSTFYRALKGSPLSSPLLAQIHLFTRLPFSAIAHMEQRRRAS